jgi:hypothetical protein
LAAKAYQNNVADHGADFFKERARRFAIREAATLGLIDRSEV